VCCTCMCIRDLYVSIYIYAAYTVPSQCSALLTVLRTVTSTETSLSVIAYMRKAVVLAVLQCRCLFNSIDGSDAATQCYTAVHEHYY
jgi:hypothetical protein